MVNTWQSDIVVNFSYVRGSKSAMGARVSPEFDFISIRARWNDFIMLINHNFSWNTELVATFEEVSRLDVHLCKEEINWKYDKNEDVLSRSL